MEIPEIPETDTRGYSRKGEIAENSETLDVKDRNAMPMRSKDKRDSEIYVQPKDKGDKAVEIFEILETDDHARG